MHLSPNPCCAISHSPRRCYSFRLLSFSTLEKRIPFCCSKLRNRLVQGISKQRFAFSLFWSRSIIQTVIYSILSFACFSSAVHLGCREEKIRTPLLKHVYSSAVFLTSVIHACVSKGRKKLSGIPGVDLHYFCDVT